MTIYVNTYTASDGTKFDLYEFDIYKTYDPQTIREVKATQHEYYSAIKRDKDNAIKLEKEALSPKQLSESQYFLLKKSEQSARDEAIADREAERQKALDDHQAYLQSSPPIAEISANAFYSFANQLAHWAGLGYAIDSSTLNSIPPSYFACKLTAPVASKK